MSVAGTGMRVVVATRAVDFRKGHDGLAAVVEHEIGLDPYKDVWDLRFKLRTDCGDTGWSNQIEVRATEDV